MGLQKMKKPNLWWRAVRPFSFTVSVIPPLLGALIAVRDDTDLKFNWIYFLLTIAGCVFAHAGSNMLSDYYDFKSRVDRKGTFGSSGVLVAALMKPEQLLKGAWTALGTAALIGLYFILALNNSLFLLGLMLLGGGLGYFYTAKPFELKYHALGDIAVFIAFGSAMSLGAYFIQARMFSWTPVLYALPIALLVDAVLHSNNLRDIHNDKAVQVTTFAAILGSHRSKWFYYFLVFGAYILTLILVLFAGLSWPALLSWLSLPLALKSAAMIANKESLDAGRFAAIDALTAQLHSAFGLLFLLGLTLDYFII